LVALVGTVERAQRMDALSRCILGDQPERARQLLEADSSLALARLPGFWPNNYVGASALHLAAWLGRRAFIDLLLAFGGKVAATDERYQGSPRSWARENDQAETERYLAEIELRAARA
jgi:ankyrin repeat protein